MENSEKTPNPFGYFRSDSMGWTDCADTDEGAQALYDQATVDLLVKQRDEFRDALNALGNNLGEFAGAMETQEKADALSGYASECFAAIASMTGADHIPDAGKMIADGMKQSTLPFAILPDEMAALERFHECVTDGEGYDVPKKMMRSIAEIGLVRRVTADIYEHTVFGLAVLNGEFSGGKGTA